MSRSECFPAGREGDASSKFRTIIRERLAMRKVESVKRKSEGTAFVVGLLFGAPGIGIYFGSWGDFFICAGVYLLFAGVYLFFLVGALPTILGQPLAVVLSAVGCGLYGVWRASKYNGG